jgi:hypothetical protein
MATALVLAWVAIVLLALSVAGLMRQVHLLLTERTADRAAATDRPEPRVLPADLMAVGAEGEGERQRAGGRGSERIVLFASTTCVACSEVMPLMVEYSRRPGTSCTVVTAATRHSQWPDELAYRENAADLFEQFGVAATPHALRIVGGDVVDSAPVGSVEALRRLIDGPAHHHAEAS